MMYQSVLTVQCLPGVCHGPSILTFPPQPPLPPPHQPRLFLLPDKCCSGQRRPFRNLQPLHRRGHFPTFLHVNLSFPVLPLFHF